jgi:hypothetical protein
MAEKEKNYEKDFPSRLSEDRCCGCNERHHRWRTVCVQQRFQQHRSF